MDYLYGFRNLYSRHFSQNWVSERLIQVSTCIHVFTCSSTSWTYLGIYIYLVPRLVCCFQGFSSQRIAITIPVLSSVCVCISWDHCSLKPKSPNLFCWMLGLRAGVGLRALKVFPTFDSGTTLPIKVMANHLLGLLMLWQLACVWLVQRQVLNLLLSLWAGIKLQPELCNMKSCHANHKSYLKGIWPKQHFEKGDPYYGLGLEVSMHIYVDIFLACSKCIWLWHPKSLGWRFLKIVFFMISIRFRYDLLLRFFYGLVLHLWFWYGFSYDFDIVLLMILAVGQNCAIWSQPIEPHPKSYQNRIKIVSNS